MARKTAALGMLLLLSAGGIASAAVVRADDVHIRVCIVLDDYPNMSGVIGVLQGLSEEGYTDYQAGKIVGEAATYVCPEHRNLVLRFAEAATSRSTIA